MGYALLEQEKELIIAAKQGSTHAFEQLIRASEHKMLSVAVGLTHCRDEAEDIYQEAMLCAYKGLSKFKMQSQFSTWLYRIVINTAMSNRRKLKNRLTRFVTRQPDATEYDYDENMSRDSHLSEESESPENRLVNKQLSRAINKAIESLSDNERIAFVLCHQQEFKIHVAAQMMECGEGSVKSYLFRARTKLRAQLQEFVR